MRIGSLNREVIIQIPAPTRDAAGQPVPGWAPLATAWANIRHQGGAEAIRSDASASTVKASIRIRRRTDVTAAMRVVHGATTYEIKAVLPDEESRDRLDLVCEVVSAG